MPSTKVRCQSCMEEISPTIMRKGKAKMFDGFTLSNGKPGRFFLHQECYEKDKKIKVINHTKTQPITEKIIDNIIGRKLWLEQ